MLRRLALLLAIVPSSLGLVGVAASGASAEAKPRSLTIGARDFSFDAPASIPGGSVKVTLDNTGAETHQVNFIELDKGVDMATYLNVIAASFQGTQDIGEYRGGPNSAAPGEKTSSIETLDPGNYVIACLLVSPDGIPHVVKGMIQPLSIEKPGKTGTQKAPQATKVALKDYEFDVPASFKGRGTIDITNRGDELHELVVDKLNDGKTVQDVIEFASQPLFQPNLIPRPFTDVGGITVLSPGGKSRIKLANLEPGNYSFFCFVPDKENVAHVALGMVYPFTVT